MAAELSDTKLAAALVEPLQVELVTPRMAPRCADLLARYGPTWCWAAFERWTSHSEGGYEYEARATWIASLPELCGPLRAAGGGDAIELARRLARSQWTWVDERIRRLCEGLPSSAALRLLVGLSLRPGVEIFPRRRAQEQALGFQVRAERHGRIRTR